MNTTPSYASDTTSASAPAAPRRRRQWTYAGPRCPQCAGPLVFGEGCSVCPVCGHSSCSI
ncbi:MAG: hypothetical protein AB7G21_09330 [Dehalococcoidia bacterium]